MTKCPTCGHDGAYVSTLSVECPSPMCQYYTERQLKEWVNAEADKEHDYTPERPIYLWTHYHTDSGD